MKKHLILFLSFISSMAVFGQNKSFILTGGWAVALPDYSDASVNGFKLGAQWEKANIQDHLGWGIEADYINFSQTGPSKISTSSANRFHTIPVTLYGKYLIGNDKIQAYAKAGAGFQFTKVSLESPSLYVSDNDFGIALTAGAGVYYTLSEYLSLNLDYGFLYLTNSTYNNGMINSASLGIAFKMN
jgi:opacity protein-like surface antigen